MAPLIHAVDLRVCSGETLVVLGPIQSGKTTLVRHLLGLERALRGSVTLGGEVFDASIPPDSKLRQLRVRVGVIFESSALLNRITVIENVELPLLEHTDVRPEEARETARELLREAGLRADDDLMPADLNRAEQRRVALARALALKPCALVLDEPTVGLDPHAAHEFDVTLQALQDEYGFGMLILTREVRHAFQPDRKIAVLVDGRIVACGDRESLLANEHPIVRRLLHRRGGE